MKKILAIAAITVVVVLGVAGAIGANSPNRPPGVSADEWAPINDTIGVVLVQGMIPMGEQRPQPPRPGILPNTGAALISPVSGYGDGISVSIRRPFRNSFWPMPPPAASAGYRRRCWAFGERSPFGIWHTLTCRPTPPDGGSSRF